MSLRIVRERMYLPLAVDVKRIIGIRGKSHCRVPIGDVISLGKPLNEIKKNTAFRALIVPFYEHDANETVDAVQKLKTSHDEEDFMLANILMHEACVSHYAECRLCDQGERPFLAMSKINLLRCLVKWQEGRFYPLNNKPNKEKQQMRKLTRKAKEFINDAVDNMIGGSGINGAMLSEDEDNPFLFLVLIPASTDLQLVMATSNIFFHLLGILPQNRNLKLGQSGDYCRIVKEEMDGDAYYILEFNHPAMLQFKEEDPEFQFALKNWNPDR